MFIYQRKIYLRETDATGNLFFSEQFHFALEAFEKFLASKNFLLYDMLTKHNFAMPIVHAEADFKKPLCVGDSIEIQLFLKEMKTTSFTLSTQILHKNIIVGTTEIVHVTVSQESKRAIPLPDFILGQLQELGSFQGAF